MPARCSIVSISGPANPQPGQGVTVSCVLKNSGSGWGAIRCVPTDAESWETIPGKEWLQLEAGQQAAFVLNLIWPNKKSVTMIAVHWDYDASQWIIDETKSWPSAGISIKMLAVLGGVVALAAVVLRKK